MLCCQSQWKWDEENETMPKDKHAEVEEVLFLWHQCLRGNGFSVTGQSPSKSIVIFLIIRKTTFRIY